ncbi:nitroreductase family protein [Mycobacterium sp. ITM-2016-00317]|uniref:nitroreductase family protein n=1 Tax=Mycobacterium sp. ITM-2016-00317 TaxID=2099694 RepID=UPI00287F4ABB|nr:nitroreductase family protein [Mycobacterium sp. ITM-2016-00317]WNG85392.1 nitroreductase family protein [Mycobacterium sp. ITM-2016-00317]
MPTFDTGEYPAESGTRASDSASSSAKYHLGLDADDVLTTTRAVRKRLDLHRPVPRELVVDCVRIATQAPSGRNRQRWDFVLIDDPKQRAAIADIWRRGLLTGVPGTGGSYDASRRPTSGHSWRRIAASLDHLATHLHEAPMLLIPCVRVDSRRELTTVRGQAGAWGSVLPAVWSFMLAARERGLGTAWTTSHLSYELEAAELLGIDAEHVVQAALTPVAFTRGTQFRPGPRADHREFIHWNTWHQTH